MRRVRKRPHLGYAIAFFGAGWLTMMIAFLVGLRWVWPGATVLAALWALAAGAYLVLSRLR